MVKRTLSTAVIALGFSVCAITATPAQAAQGKCLVGKNKCAVNRAGGLLKCQQQAATPGKPSDPNTAGCVDKVKAKFDGGATPEKGCFEKLEAKTSNDCLTFDDTSAVATLVDQCVATLVAGIDAPPAEQTKCEVAKQKCVASKLAGVLKCYQKAQTPGKPTDPNTDSCVDKVRAKFDGGDTPEKGCIAKIENKSGNDCQPPTGNTSALEGAVDNCVAGVIAALETPTPPTTTTSTTGPAPTPTPSTTGPAPTTTSSTIGGATTTTSTSPTPTTTSTTNPTGATCAANGLNVTVAINYPESLLGGISAIRASLNYTPPLSIPGTGNVLSVRQRVTSLLGTGFTVTPRDQDTNADTVDDQLFVQASSTLNSIQPGSLYLALFDCAAGTPVSTPANVSCVLAGAADTSGIPFPPELANQITCSLTLAAAP